MGPAAHAALKDPLPLVQRDRWTRFPDREADGGGHRLGVGVGLRSARRRVWAPISARLALVVQGTIQGTLSVRVLGAVQGIVKGIVEEVVEGVVDGLVDGLVFAAGDGGAVQADAGLVRAVAKGIFEQVGQNLSHGSTGAPPGRQLLGALPRAPLEAGGSRGPLQ